jgi:hypothetical protein
MNSQGWKREATGSNSRYYRGNRLVKLRKTTKPPQSGQSVTLLRLEPGTYKIQVRSIAAWGSLFGVSVSYDIISSKSSRRWKLWKWRPVYRERNICLKHQLSLMRIALSLFGSYSSMLGLNTGLARTCFCFTSGYFINFKIRPFTPR